jgi:hypothetical protein
MGGSWPLNWGIGKLGGGGGGGGAGFNPITPPPPLTRSIFHSYGSE